MGKDKPGTICGYVLDKRPEVVNKLQRTKSGLWVIVGQSKSLNGENIRLIVPEGLDVYRTERRIKYAELFFVSKTEDKTSQAYASLISLDKNKSLDFSKNVGTLIEYRWYDGRSSNLIFNRLINGWGYEESSTAGHHLFSNCVSGNGKHPFAKE